LIEQLSIHVEQSDASYMPSVVAVLAGNTIGGLKELKQTSIPSGQREFVLVSGFTQVGSGVNVCPSVVCVYVYLLCYVDTITML
jgi:hypothetical protein